MPALYTPRRFETAWLGALLFIVHTWPDDDDTPGRIISARKATRQERKAYEDGEH